MSIKPIYIIVLGVSFFATTGTCLQAEIPHKRDARIIAREIHPIRNRKLVTDRRMHNASELWKRKRRHQLLMERDRKIKTVSRWRLAKERARLKKLGREPLRSR